MFLQKDEFLNIIDKTPLVSIDLIMVNNKNEALLGCRNNKPAQGFWFVPGGRIQKNETIKMAYERILKSETGLNIPFDKTNLLGVYDHIYNDNFAEEEGVNTHYVVIGLKITIPENATIANDNQHSAFKWISISELIGSEQVHQNTKNYFL